MPDSYMQISIFLHFTTKRLPN
ncbi:hypothetical protein AF31_01556, partial [Klebsiella pneumoniae CHS 75]